MDDATVLDELPPLTDNVEQALRDVAEHGVGLPTGCQASSSLVQGHSVLRCKTAVTASPRYSAKCSKPSTIFSRIRRSSVSAVLRDAASTCGAWLTRVRA